MWNHYNNVVLFYFCIFCTTVTYRTVCSLISSLLYIFASGQKVKRQISADVGKPGFYGTSAIIYNCIHVTFKVKNQYLTKFKVK